MTTTTTMTTTATAAAAAKEGRPRRQIPRGGRVGVPRRCFFSDVIFAPPASTAAFVLALLDFNAFKSSEITKDEKKSAPILSDDEALCRYGAPLGGEEAQPAKFCRRHGEGQ